MLTRLARRRPRVVWLLTTPLLLAATHAAAAGTEAEALRHELEETRRELSETRSDLAGAIAALEALTRRVDRIQAGEPTTQSVAVATASPPVASAAPAPPSTEATARLAPVNVDNPALSVAIDTTLATDVGSGWESIGYPDGWNFALKNAELFISAPIDPFLRGYLSVNASSEEGFHVEEAALVTTALPGNLTVKGGRFFADFGRLPHWHDEALPFVDRPPSIDRLIGGESTAEGVEISWLLPLEQFVEVTGGLYNAMGAEYLEELNEDGFFGRRQFDELNFLVRPHAYFDLTDSLNLEVGGSWLGVPEDDERQTFGADLTLRHQPGTVGGYEGFVWGSEWIWNDQRFTERDDDGNAIGRDRHVRTGGYSYLETFFARRFSAGTRFDYSEAPEGPRDAAKTASAFLTWMPSEFQRLRFQFDTTWGDQPTNERFTLQWTAFLGSHRHGFAQR